MDEELFLQSNEFVHKFKTVFSDLRKTNDFVDVTLACHDGQVSAHKVILSASSSLFLTILKSNPHPHPLLYLRGVTIKQLSPLLHFMYRGEVKIAKGELNMFLDTARELQIDGLANTETETKQKDAQEKESIKCEPENYDEYDYADTSYATEGSSFENKEITAINEPEMMHMDTVHMNSYKVKKIHKGSTGGRLLRNPVWDYFVKLDNRSSCNKCGFSLMGYNTSSLIKHLENRHMDTYMEYREKYEVAWNEKINHSEKKINVFSSEAENPEKKRQRRVQGRLTKNPVHNFFTRLDSYSNCNHCPSSMLGHNPTTLSKHLESHHTEEFRQFRELYRLAWENKRKMMKEKNKLVQDSQEGTATDHHLEEGSEQWNDTFEIGYDDETGGNVDGDSNFVQWNSD